MLHALGHSDFSTDREAKPTRTVDPSQDGSPFTCLTTVEIHFANLPCQPPTEEKIQPPGKTLTRWRTSLAMTKSIVLVEPTCRSARGHCRDSFVSAN
jgi:hypothetical protein